jgi:hypothetical protein
VRIRELAARPEFQYRTDKVMIRKSTKAVVKTYNKNAREHIHGLLRDYLVDAGVVEYTDALLACVDELIKNAVKANYKFVLVRDEITARTGSAGREGATGTALDREHYRVSASEVLSGGEISARVRQILDEESIFISISNRVRDEKRSCHEDEKKVITSLERLTAVKKEIQDGRISTVLKIERTAGELVLTVNNTAPILPGDLQRIEQKRCEHLTCLREGREHEFYINNIDTSDSGFGFGYAVINSCLYSMGLDPDRCLSINPYPDTTVSMKLPIKEMQYAFSREVELEPAV